MNQTKTTRTGSIPSTSLSKKSPAAPPGRRGLPHLLRLSFVPLNRVRSVIAHRLPLDVWGPLLARGLGGALILIFVAYLGHLSQDFSSLGGVVAVDHQVKALMNPGEDKNGRSPNDADIDSPSDDHQEHPRLDASTIEAKAQVASGDSARNKNGCPEPESNGPKGITDDGRVILNEANVQELSLLPGIGESRAQAIVALRTRLGGFKKVTDLLRIKGVGYKTLNKMKEKLVLDRPLEDSTSPTEGTSSSPVAALDVPHT